mgnify:CR=1 FL=1|jgi:hypothetical protein|tara:strand:- start:99 stop:545 length:447 start_codon:yes stop_codon:yes gene_type:complete
MATLTITLTESVTLGDGASNRGTTNVQAVTIDEVDHRIMDVGTSEIKILQFAAANGPGTFADGTVKYLRITNLDASNFVTLRIQQSDSEYFVKLEAEDNFLLGNTVMDAHEDGDTAVGAAATLANIDSIWADADTAACQVEYFIGSIG